MRLKSTEYLSSMTMKSDVKFEEKLTSGLENEMMNLANFHQSTQKRQNWYFDGILLYKVENVWEQNFQRIYVSWLWLLKCCKIKNSYDMKKYFHHYIIFFSWCQNIFLFNQNKSVFKKIYFHYIKFFFHDIKINFFSIIINLYSIK